MEEHARARPNARPSALADIHFASLADDADLTPSEDETPEERALELETVQSAIGVSIGQQQTRLISPNTPAAEKAAAFDDAGMATFKGWEPETASTPNPNPQSPPLGPPLEFQDLQNSQSTETDVDDTDDLDDTEPAQNTQNTQNPTSPRSPRLPSPWRAGPKKLHVDDRDHRSTLRDSFAHSRRRAMSGGSATDTLKKFINFHFPSMPKTPSLLNFSLPTFSVSSFDSSCGRPAAQRERVSTVSNASTHNGITQHDGLGSSLPADRNASTATSRPAGVRPLQPSTEPIFQRPFSPQTGPSSSSNTDQMDEDTLRRSVSRLRRSNSEGSLLLYRQISCASSLGDDSRFENVQEQVNSRLKAIKDSWQDANFKLPSLPTMSNFSFGSREDMFRRSGNTSLKDINPDPSGSSGSNRVSFLANSGFSSSRGTSTRLARAKDSPASVAAPPSSPAVTHPYFSQACQDLTGDVVILGGYRGSVLRSAKPPHRQLWAPVKVGLNLRKVDLEVGLDPEDEETEEERIISAGMLTHIGPIDIAKRLFKRLRASENARNGDLRVHNYGYDWRLSPHLLSKRFIKYLQTLPCNQPGVPIDKRGAIIIAHSLGGMITRHAINQHPELVAGVVYAGVPQSCINILGPLRNGDDVLLSSRVLTAQVNFTIRTSFALLPLDGRCFINRVTKEEYPLDLFDVKTWQEHSLSPCIAQPTPHPNTLSPNLRSASGLFNAMSQALPSLPSRKPSLNTGKGRSGSPQFSQHGSSNSTPAPGTLPKRAQTVPLQRDPSSSELSHSHSHFRDATDAARNAASQVADSGANTTGIAPQMSSNSHAHSHAQYKSADTTAGASSSNPATTVTIPHDKAVAYLTRTLAEVKAFKQELAYQPALGDANEYPPIALIYGKSTPTVYGAKIESYETIKRADAYDELAFASGDGVVLARAAMAPEGYRVESGGVVSSDRGHVTLLGDLEAVGRCLTAVVGARRRGVGLGLGLATGVEREEGLNAGLGVVNSVNSE